MKYAFFPGCVSQGGAPELYTATKLICSKVGIEIEEISGTNIRILLESGKRPPKHVMRPEVIDAFDGNEMFVQ